MGLFRLGQFTAHSGRTLDWKVECDALAPDDWKCLAAMIGPQLRFGAVEGVPRGGLAFADALAPYATEGPLLIADDVLTTGGSMEAQRSGRDAIGVVAFARSAPPSWVSAVWRMVPPGALVIPTEGPEWMEHYALWRATVQRELEEYALATAPQPEETDDA